MNNLNYPITVLKLSDEDGGGFAALVEALPGCLSDGATEAEAISNAHDAIEAWIEEATALGRPIPEPEQPLMRKYG